MSALPINRGQTARPFPVPAPVGGLNAIDSLAAMPPGDASTLTNWFPYADRVEVRPGYALLATNAAVTSSNLVLEGFRNLMLHTSSGTVFGAYSYDGGAGGRWVRIYSISSAGVLANVRELVSAGQFALPIGEWTNFISGSGTSYMLLMAWRQPSGGGASTFIPQAYDGSSWSVPSITGITVAGLPGVHSHRGRLWFYGGLNAASPSVYYLPVGAISGAVTAFNLGPFVPKGGSIVAMRTWTIDGGQGGSDDLAVFVTSAGQAIVYAGYDPASAATWSLVGVFDLGAMASYANVTGDGAVNDAYALKTEADLLFSTPAGIKSASTVLRGQESGVSISRKVNPLITTSAAAWLASATATPLETPNWKLAWFPAKRMFLLAANDPALTSVSTGPTVKRVTSTVYAMNTETGAWAQFTGMNMRDALVVGNSLYFIDGGRSVYNFTGSAADVMDAGTAITFEVRQAYNYLQSPSNKHVPLMQPMLKATGNFSLTVEADADFNNGTISAYTSYTVGSTQNLQPWISANKYGRAIAPHLKGQTTGSGGGVLSWYATNFMAKDARGI